MLEDLCAKLIIILDTFGQSAHKNCTQPSSDTETNYRLSTDLHFCEENS